jgi:hypothetical protein
VLSPEDIYLHAVVNRHRAYTHSEFPQLQSLLRSWAAPHLESITLSGSHAKATALRDSDVDLFLSLSPSTPGPLAAIHTSLAAHLRDYCPQTRNVSVRVTFQGAAIDLVPGRRRESCTHHTLWQVRHNTWLQTGIAEQIRYVRSSGLLNEILALKIWCRRHSLRFPSFALELAVIHALTPAAPLSQSFLSLLHFLATDFPATRLLDPANSNNVVSDSLTDDQKHRISAAAILSLNAPTWPEIL